eukprot:COSAG06_NODE_29491_length_555_cov_1.171053_1_plen_113_part_10
MSGQDRLGTNTSNCTFGNACCFSRTVLLWQPRDTPHTITALRQLFQRCGKRSLFGAIYDTKNDNFAKTGSGQTYVGKALIKKKAFFLQVSGGFFSDAMASQASPTTTAIPAVV